MKPGIYGDLHGDFINKNRNIMIFIGNSEYMENDGKLNGKP